jgi:hypothetical protein
LHAVIRLGIGLVVERVAIGEQDVGVLVAIQRFGRDSGNFRRTDNKSLRLQGKFDVFGHGTLVPIQVQ